MISTRVRKVGLVLLPVLLALTLALMAPASAVPGTTVQMPACCSLDTVGLGGNVFTLVAVLGGPERFQLLRIDASTNTITGRLVLPPGASAGDAFNVDPMTVADGSIWVTQYFENQVLRIDPVRMRITARVAVGRSPGSVATDGSAVWVVEQTDGAIARIDPASNSVTARVHVASRNATDFAYQAAYDGSQLLVSLPSTGRVAHVNPRNLRVAYDAVGQAAVQCARILPMSGGYWLDDTECSNDYYRWGTGARAITAHINPDPLGDFGSAIDGSVLYIGEFARDGSAGYVGKFDATSGAPLGRQNVGDDAEVPRIVNGSLWVPNWTDHTLQHLPLF